MYPSAQQVQRWRELYLSGTLQKPDLPFEGHIQLYEDTFQIKALPPFYPLWYPDFMGEVRQTNLFAVLSELNFHPADLSYEKLSETYAALHRWSVLRRSDFWRYMIIERLKVPFQRQPDTILAFPKGDIAQPLWLGGAVWNVIDMIFLHSPEKVALVYEQENGKVQHWTYGQLFEAIRQVAGALRAQGLQVGERIAICMPLRPEAAILYLAALYAGISAVTIPDSLSGEEIATRLRIANPQLLFIQDGLLREGKFIPLYERLRQFPLPRTFVIAAGDRVQVRLRNNASTWENFLSEGSPLTSPYNGASDREIGILFSSGTTAEPKAIPWTQLTALKAITDAHLYHDVHATDVLAWHTNLGWMMGPWLLFAGLSHGAAVAMYEGAPTTAGYCKFVEKQKVSILGVVPSLVRRWIESQAWEGADWSGIRLFSSTGEASNPWHMWQLMIKAGYKPIIEYCGGTEIGGGYITSTLLHPNAPSQFSAPALGLDFVLLGEDGKPAEEGELFLVPPSIGLSQMLLNADHEKVYYSGTPFVEKGWRGASSAEIPTAYAGVPMRLRRHGDYMRRLSTGYWVSGGRADDAMNLGGIKISAAEIERAVSSLPSVSEVAAIAVPPPEGGPDRLVLYVVPKASVKVSAQELKELAAQMIREKLSPLFHLHDVVLIDELPRTASNKVMRRVLRTQYLQKQ